MKKNIVRIMIILTFIIIECIVLGFSNSYANTNGKALKESEKNLIMSEKENEKILDDIASTNLFRDKDYSKIIKMNGPEDIFMYFFGDEVLDLNTNVTKKRQTTI